MVSSGDQSRLAIYEIFGPHLVLSASSTLLLRRGTRAVAPFNVFIYMLGDSCSWATYKRCADIIFHGEKSSFLTYRYQFSTGTPFSLLEHERSLTHTCHINLPKVQFQEYRWQGQCSSWIDGYVRFLLFPGDPGDQHIPGGPVALVA